MNIYNTNNIFKKIYYLYKNKEMEQLERRIVLVGMTEWENYNWENSSQATKNEFSRH